MISKKKLALASVDLIKDRLANSRMGNRIALALLRDYFNTRLAAFELSQWTGERSRNGAGVELTLIVIADSRTEFTGNCLCSLSVDRAVMDTELFCVGTVFPPSSKRLQSMFPEVTVLQYPDCDSPAEIANRAAELAHGQYILFLRNTVEATPAFVSAAAAIAV